MLYQNILDSSFVSLPLSEQSLNINTTSSQRIKHQYRYCGVEIDNSLNHKSQNFNNIGWLKKLECKLFNSKAIIIDICFAAIAVGSIFCIQKTILNLQNQDMKNNSISIFIILLLIIVLYAWFRTIQCLIGVPYACIRNNITKYASNNTSLAHINKSANSFEKYCCGVEIITNSQEELEAQT